MRNSPGARIVVILLGGPGAGKGTQATSLTGFLKIPHVSTGQLLRSEARACSPSGLRAMAVMEAGGLVDNDHVNELVSRRIAMEDCSSGFLLDGYPRNIDQAVIFGQSLGADERLIVIDISIELERLIPRLAGRRTCVFCGAVYHPVTTPPRRAGICNGCGGPLLQRPDDRPEAISVRFKTYREMTEPLADFYRRAGVYHRVDGARSPDQIAQDIRQLFAMELMHIPPRVEISAAPAAGVS